MKKPNTIFTQLCNCLQTRSHIQSPCPKCRHPSKIKVTLIHPSAKKLNKQFINKPANIT